MTIAVSTGRWPYTGNGATTTFPYTAKVFVSTDLRVELDDVLQTSGYTVSGVGSASGGNVIFAVPPAASAKVVITIAPPILQSTDLTAPIDVDATEAQFDKTLNILKMLAEKIGRALKLKGSSALTDLTVADPEAGKFIRWKSDLSGTENANVTGQGSVGLPLVVGEGGTGATTAAGARANLGVPLDNLQVTGGSITGITDLAVADGGTGGSTAAAARSNLATAPANPTYLLLDGSGLASELANRRTLAAGSRATLTDAGAGSTLTVNGGLGRSYLAGLGLANNGADSTNDIDIAVGEARSSDNTTDLVLSGALTKQINADWAAGTGAGGRIASETLADGTWFLYLFMRSGGTTDVCFSQSLSPTFPDGGTKGRRIGAILREGGTIVSFTQRGDMVKRNTPVADFNTTVAATTVQTLALSVPDNIVVEALTRWHVNGNMIVYAHETTAADAAPSTAGAPGVTIGAGAGPLQSNPLRLLTNTSRQIHYRTNSTVVTLMVITDGWIDRRGRDD